MWTAYKQLKTILFAILWISVATQISCGAKNSEHSKQTVLIEAQDSAFKLESEFLLQSERSQKNQFTFTQVKTLEDYIVSQQIESLNWNVPLATQVSKLKFIQFPSHLVLTDQVSFHFKFKMNESERFELDSFNHRPAQLIHSSAKEGMISWTVVTADDQSINLYLEKEISAINVRPAYWPNLKTLTLCGAESRSLKKVFFEVIEAWNRTLTLIGTSVISTRMTHQTIPLGDLTSQCIYVSEFMAKRKRHSGETWNIASRKDSKFIDGDILISSRLLEPSFNRELKWTLMHEIGHWLGLSHPPNHSIESIMSYRNDIDQPTPFDIENLIEIYRTNRK